jgi:hypothetical protein
MANKAKYSILRQFSPNIIILEQIRSNNVILLQIMAFYSILLQFRPNIGILDQIRSNNGFLWQKRPNNGILQYASHVQQICASNFYFAHNFYPNLTPHEAGDSDRLVLLILVDT